MMNIELGSQPNIKNSSNLPSKFEMERSKYHRASSGYIHTTSASQDLKNLENTNPKNGGSENNEELEGLGELSNNQNSSSRTVYLSVLINLLFIVSFLLEYKIGTTNEINFALKKEIDDYTYYQDPLQAMQDTKNLDDANSFIYYVFLERILMLESLYSPTNYQNTLNIAVGVNPVDSTPTKTETGNGTQYTDKSKYRFLNSFNMFKGLNFSYSYLDLSGTQIRKSTPFFKFIHR